MAIWDTESAGIIKTLFTIIQVEGIVKGFYHTHNHLDKRILWWLVVGEAMSIEGDNESHPSHIGLKTKQIRIKPNFYDHSL